MQKPACAPPRLGRFAGFALTRFDAQRLRIANREAFAVRAGSLPMHGRPVRGFLVRASMPRRIGWRLKFWQHPQGVAA